MKLEDEIKAIDGGRFSKLVDALPGICESCRECGYFNPQITDPMRRCRCRVPGSCPGATLSQEVQSYIWRKLGWVKKDDS